MTNETPTPQEYQMVRITTEAHAKLRELADNFPGCRLETLMDDWGWGAAANRDDVGIDDGRRVNLFSRLQVAVGPYNKYHVLEILAKGTIRNKETFSRNHYQRLGEVDLERFRELIEQWVLDYAEMYAAAA